MAEYIEREALLEWIKNLELLNLQRISDGLKPKGLNTDGMLHMVRKLPAADVVEVVRCRDCRHYGGVTFGRTCRMFSGAYTRVEMSEDGFCSYGERKDGAS